MKTSRRNFLGTLLATVLVPTRRERTRAAEAPQKTEVRLSLRRTATPYPRYFWVRNDTGKRGPFHRSEADAYLWLTEEYGGFHNPTFGTRSNPGDDGLPFGSTIAEYARQQGWETA